MSDAEYRKYLVKNVSSYLDFKSDQLREHLEEVAYRYVRSIYQDTKRYIDAVVKEYSEKLAGR